MVNAVQIMYISVSMIFKYPYELFTTKLLIFHAVFSILEDDFSNNNRYAVNEPVNGMANTIESKRRDVLMRSAIKYWVERHKQIVK